MYPLFCISDAVKQLKFGVSNNAIESHMDNAMSSSCVENMIHFSRRGQAYEATPQVRSD